MNPYDATLPSDEAQLADGAPSLPSYGRFVALGVIGAGGMGVVLRAHDPELGRDVAIKLVGPSRSSAGTGEAPDDVRSQRLHREAQAMARLSHPNVVTVYEMGQAGDQRFIAMELVEGVTLGRWLEQRPRSWREIVAAFIQCGRGLAAAHDAGLVHRDFKPDNVLVGADGRPRVSDFGLVTSGVLDDDRVVGTPAYMAPEQWSGAEVDARTDQFAFCVALWEALFGVRPFAGSDSASMREAALVGRLREPPRQRRAGRSLLSALRRGLAPDREARWPDMAALLARLEASLRRRRARWIAAAVAAAGLAGAGVIAMGLSSSRPDACPDPRGQLAGKWDRVIEDQVEAALGAGGANPTVTAGALAGLDGYATQWTTGVNATCRAREARTQPQDVLDKRAICLERGRAALGAVTAVLVGADAKTVARAGDAIARLPDLEACDDIERFAASVALPSDPTLRAQIGDALARLGEIDAHRLAGDYQAAFDQAQRVVPDVRALDHAPTLAVALIALGDVAYDRSDLIAADRAYREAASVAAEGHDDLAAAEAWSDVLFIAGDLQDNLEAAAALDPVVDAAVRRAGDPPRLRHSYLMSSGLVAARRGDLDTAHARFTAAAALDTGNLRHRGAALRNLALVVWQRDGAAQAVDAAARAAEATEAAVGADHPEMAAALKIQSQVANGSGHPEEALPLAERALAINLKTFGPEAPVIANAYETLGNIHVKLGNVELARDFLDRSIALKERLGVPEASLAMSVAALGAMLQRTGHGADAIPYLERARGLLAGSSGTATADYLGLSGLLASALQELGRCAAARPILAEVEPGTRKLAHNYPGLLLTIGRCAQDRGIAMRTFQQAKELCLQQTCNAELVAALDTELSAVLDRRRPR